MDPWDWYHLGDVRYDQLSQKEQAVIVCILEFNEKIPFKMNPVQKMSEYILELVGGFNQPL